MNESQPDPGVVGIAAAGEPRRRSGVRSIPEALRLAPGVEVARNSSSSWTISMRGFSSDLSNKLLVLIDGRSVHSPLYAGVFWDAQDILLDDVDRIELIAGPGGTLWGANAVNGVINIITSAAADTQGGLVKVDAGDEEESFGAVRFGGRLNPDTAARAGSMAWNWQPLERLTASLGICNANDSQHPEFGIRNSEFGEDYEIERSTHLKFLWAFWLGRMKKRCQSRIS